MAKKWFLLPFVIFLIFCCILLLVWRKQTQRKTVKIGILHSLSGNLAISEQPVADATLLAVKEINAAGGILGKQIEPLLVDGKSDEGVFAAEAERLIKEEKVTALFGCWTSPSRILVGNIAQKYNSVLFYPVQFEGLEDSTHVVYTSTTPNQQIIPGVTWCIQNLGKKFFLVGSDRILHEIIKDIVYAHNGTIVGEEYLALDDKNVEPIIQKIISAKPDVILNNIEGDTNILFFTKLRERGITPEKIPTMSFSISEPELQLFNTHAMTGDYATWSYFESIDTLENKIFVKKIKSNYGEKQTTSDAMEAAYYGVYLWKQAVEKAQSTEPSHVLPLLYNQAFNAPQGTIHIAAKSLQTWSYVRIGKIRSDKQFTIVWSSQKSIQPESYLPSRSIEEWHTLRTKICELEGAPC
jgi:urea transport system substrate-binding protein